MNEYIKKTFRITAGIFLLLLGAIGGLIPIFQGWVFGLAGLWLLSHDIPFLKKYHDRLVNWYEQKKAGKKSLTQENNKTDGEN